MADTQSGAGELTGKTFFGHPRGLATLFFTEMWERFSYYGMRALLVLFMVDKVQNDGLGYGDERANAIYGLYTSMVYLLALWGGWVAVFMIPYVCVAVAELVANPASRANSAVVAISSVCAFLAAMDHVRRTGASLRR